ncbi:MAG TPA: hypothetical protein VMS17_10910, partial [Gemmataceae bacterium]|nr:hypothetical protein [Gemmataceae bacterium]
AVVNWGDGVISTVTLGVNGDLYDVPANHTYQTAGVFSVQTLFYNAANVLIGATVSTMDAQGQTSVDGPAVVPGNSKYSFFFNIPPMDAKLSAYTINDSTVGSNWSIEPVQQAGGIIGFGVTAQFANKPAQGKLRLEYQPTGQKGFTEVDFQVTVVKVVVENTAQSFTPDKSFKDKNPNGKGYKSDLGPTVNTPLAIDPPARVQNGTVQSIQDPNTPALTWEAKVTLVGWGPKHDDGVTHIQVGFQQVGYITGAESFFNNTRIRSSILLQDFLDVALTREMDRPWYTLMFATANPPKPANYLPGRLYGTDPTVIGANDNPLARAITVYDNNTQVAASVDNEISFTLNVAAATYDEMPYDGLLFREAVAYWSWNASGDIMQNGKDGNNILTSWTPSAAAGVKQPAKGKWDVDIARPVPLLTGGDLLNEALKKQTYTTK